MDIILNVKWKCSRDLALDVLRQIKISHKPEHDTNTQLHNETAVRILDYDEKDQLYTAMYMRSLGNIESFSKLENIAVAEKLGTSPAVQKMRERCAAIIKAVNTQKFAAEQSLKQKNADNSAVGLKEVKITDQALVQEAIRLAHVGTKYPRVEKFTLVNIHKKEQCGYVPDSNHHVDFFVYTEGKKKGQIGWECVKSIDAANPNFKPDWEGELVWSVCKGDILELYFDEETLVKENIPRSFVTKNNQQEYCMLAKVLKFGDGNLYFVSAFDARAEQKNALKENPDPFMLWKSSKYGLGFYCNVKARKVILSPFGKVKKKLQRLWNGKKV